MASRSDVSVLWYLSPRVVLIAAPSNSITIQDLHDTSRDLEDEPATIVYPTLISTAGKEDLGDGITRVGLTATLQNAVVAFQAHKTFVTNGTVTTADSTGTNLYDSSATFETDGVNIGAWIVNNSDGSIATVLRVTSETELLTDVLGGGADNRFDFGDHYRILNVRQCEISGGNLVAVDDGGTGMNPVLPTAGTQVTRTLSTSAALVYASGGGGTGGGTEAKLWTVLDGTTLRMTAWLVRDGETVTGPTAAIVRFYDDSGVELFNVDLGAPDAHGTFTATQSISVLTANRIYTADVAITDATGTKIDRHPQQTFDVT